MLPRVLEPEVMDTPEEAHDYDAMDHSVVNRVFVDDFLAEMQAAGRLQMAETGKPLTILDAGTGTAQIPIELLSRFAARSPAFQESRTSRTSQVHITATDIAEEMLKVARRNVNAAELADSIHLRHVDCKSLPYADATFDAVISNSIVHHIPEPMAVLSEMWRVLKPGGALFVRDLLRPPDGKTLDHLVQSYAGDENDHSQQMFRDSLHAALTVDEMRRLLQQLGIPAENVHQTTDRHWTLSAVR